MDLGLNGKVAVITGSTQGIGKASAVRLAQEGAKVVICGRDQAKLDNAAAEIKKAGGEVLACRADVSKAADIERLISAAIERFGRIDILVNNAGTSIRGKFLEVDDAKWSSDLELKLFGAIRCSRLALPYMKKQGSGRIVNITTSGAKQPGAESMPTTVSRAAGLALTKALFDPQARRDLQNEEAANDGPDTLANTLRAGTEASVGIIDVLLHELEGVGHFELIDPLSGAWPTVLAAVKRVSG